MEPILAILGVVAVVLYLFNQIHFLDAKGRQWVTSAIATLAVLWATASVVIGWVHIR